MNWKKLSTYLLLQALVSILPAGHAAAEVQLTLIPSSSGNVFILQGTNLEGLAVMDFDFSYDESVMENPKAVRGDLFPSDAIFDFNPFAPGAIHLFTKTGKAAIKGSGTIATISFEGVENAEGSLEIINTNLVSGASTPVIARVRTLGRPAQPPQPKTEPVQDSNATAQAVQVQASPDQTTTVTPTTTTSTGTGTVTTTANQAVQAASNQTRAVTSSTSSTPGTVMLPASQPEKETIAASTAPAPSEAQPVERQAAASPSQYRAAPETPVPAPAVPLKSVTYQSVLERIKEFSGARTPKNLTDLFRPASGQIVRQEPAVAISDGESVVSLRIELPLTLKETPSFSLRKASMASLQQLDDGSWLIEAKPLKNTVEARLTINCDGSTVQFPLVVAPPLEPVTVVSNGSTEEGFIRYLKSKEPGSDLNGDGKSDYLDDYIFTANYLARQNNPKPKPAGEKLP